MSPDASLLGVEVHGEAGPDLILLHGFGASRYTWRHWVPELARDHRLHLVDLKGFGSAPKPRDRAYAPADQAGLVKSLVEARGLERITLVGHSYGGAVALILALLLLDARPSLLQRLVLVAGAAYPQRLPRFMRLASVPILGEVALRLTPSRLLIRAALRSIYHDPGEVTREQVEAYARPLRDPGGTRAAIRTARQILRDDPARWTSQYPRVRVPTLLLWGQHDPVVPLAVAHRLLDDLPRARLATLDACGHVPQEERPRASLEVVRSFLARTGPPARDPAGSGQTRPQA